MNPIQIKLWITCRAKLLLYKVIYRGRLNVGRDITFRRSFIINIADVGDPRLIIGDGCFFNNGCSINCHSRIEIGASCLFGENVKIYDHNHVFQDTSEPIKDQGLAASFVRIEEDCWLGSNVVVLPGITIGKGSIIGAGTVVSRSIPSQSVVVSRQALLCKNRGECKWTEL